MTKTLLALVLSFAALGLHAESLQLPATASHNSELPKRGQSMQQVESSHGAPLRRHAAVGGGNPRHPPITRWDYQGFAVFFEHQRVIDAVVPSAPKPLRNVEQLKR